MRADDQLKTLDLIQDEIKIAATLVLVDGNVGVRHGGELYATEYHIDDLAKMIENGTSTANHIAKVLVGVASKAQVDRFSKDVQSKYRTLYYVISVQLTKDPATNEDKEQWRYAGFDRGSYGSGDPCWLYSERDCEKFNDIEKAKEWFDEYKNFMFGRYYNRLHFDLSTLAIRKVVTVTEANLSI